jgi:hypothetical protein
VQRRDGSYATIYQPLTLAHLEKHLRGEITLGAYALNAENMGQWVCLDADAETSWQGLLTLAHHLQAQNLPAYLETSRRGGHLWLFTSSLPGLHLRRFAKALLAEHHLEGIEVYPKQDILTSGTGSLVRLPLGIHRKSGKRYPFITPQCQFIAPTLREHLHILTQPQRLPSTFILQMLTQVPAVEALPKPTPAFRTTPIHPELPVSERIKSAISVLDFVGQYVSLDTNNTGFCPFHDDQRHSFGVNAAANYWNCFAGCGGGSIIDFWMRWREQLGQDGSFKATITDLARLLL